MLSTPTKAAKMLKKSPGIFRRIGRKKDKSKTGENGEQGEDGNNSSSDQDLTSLMSQECSFDSGTPPIKGSQDSIVHGKGKRGSNSSIQTSPLVSIDSTQMTYHHHRTSLQSHDSNSRHQSPSIMINECRSKSPSMSSELNLQTEPKPNANISTNQVPNHHHNNRRLSTINSSQENTTIKSQENSTGENFEWKRPDHYSLRKTFSSPADPGDVGQLKVHLICAKGLYAADFGGKSDPFAVLELRDLSYESKVISRTLEPDWREEFVFPIRDISDVLTITIYDKDRFSEPELLGRISFPLIKLTSSELEQIFALKDKRMEKRAKGSHPQLYLKFDIAWNQARAAFTLIQNRSDENPEAFKRSKFVQNVTRLRTVLDVIKAIGNYAASCFEWENPTRTIRAFFLFEAVVYFFEPWMMPLLLLIFLYVLPTHCDIPELKNWLETSEYYGRPPLTTSKEEAEDQNKEEHSDDEDEDEKKSKFASNIDKAKEVSAFVQNALGWLASSAERLKNLARFAVPFYSWLALAFILVGSVAIYIFTLRGLLMIWGINKFSKKIIRPDYVPVSEFMNFLSRMPDDVTLKQSRYLSIFDEALLKEEEEKQRKNQMKRVPSMRFNKKLPNFFNLGGQHQSTTSGGGESSGGSSAAGVTSTQHHHQTATISASSEIARMTAHAVNNLQPHPSI